MKNLGSALQKERISYTEYNLIRRKTHEDASYKKYLPALRWLIHTPHTPDTSIPPRFQIRGQPLDAWAFIKQMRLITESLKSNWQQKPPYNHPVANSKRPRLRVQRDSNREQRLLSALEFAESIKPHLLACTTPVETTQVYLPNMRETSTTIKVKGRRGYYDKKIKDTIIGPPTVEHHTRQITTIKHKHSPSLVFSLLNIHSLPPAPFEYTVQFSNLNSLWMGKYVLLRQTLPRELVLRILPDPYEEEIWFPAYKEQISPIARYLREIDYECSIPFWGVTRDTCTKAMPELIPRYRLSTVPQKLKPLDLTHIYVPPHLRRVVRAPSLPYFTDLLQDMVVPQSSQFTPLTTIPQTLLTVSKPSTGDKKPDNADSFATLVAPRFYNVDDDES